MGSDQTYFKFIELPFGFIKMDELWTATRWWPLTSTASKGKRGKIEKEEEERE